LTGGCKVSPAARPAASKETTTHDDESELNWNDPGYGDLCARTCRSISGDMSHHMEMKSKIPWCFQADAREILAAAWYSENYPCYQSSGWATPRTLTIRLTPGSTKKVLSLPSVLI